MLTRNCIYSLRKALTSAKKIFQAKRLSFSFQMNMRWQEHEIMYLQGGTDLHSVYLALAIPHICHYIAYTLPTG